MANFNMRWRRLLRRHDYLLKPIDRMKLQHLVEKIIIDDLNGTVEGADRDDQDSDPVLGVRYDSLSKLTNRILLIVKAEYAQNLSLKSVAERFRMNGTYLGQLFLKETHKKFSEYLMAYRCFEPGNAFRTRTRKSCPSRFPSDIPI